MNVSHITISIVLSLTLFGCASKHYEEAKNKDTISAYNKFLKEYGDSKYAYKARNRLNQLIEEYNSWYRARKRNSIIGYDVFLLSYPNGKYASKAKYYRDKLKKEKYINDLKIKIKNSKSAIEQAIIMTKYAYIKPYNYAIKNDSFLKKYYKNAWKCFKTKKDIIVLAEKYKSDGFSWLSVDTTYIYAGKIFKGDIVYKDGNYIRTLHNVNDLTSFTTNHNEWLENITGKEAFGSYSEFKNEHKLSDKDLFSIDFRSSNVEKFIPTRYSTKTTSLGGSIGEFISDHPIASIIRSSCI